MILARERGRRVDIDCGGTQETDEVNWELKKKKQMGHWNFLLDPKGAEENWGGG